MSACRSCGRPVIWAVTPGGRSIPLDPDPTDDGNLTLDTSSLRAVATPARATTAGYRKLYRSHFTTCPHANQWRRK